jgi:hypothetical protein
MRAHNLGSVRRHSNRRRRYESHSPLFRFAVDESADNYSGNFKLYPVDAQFMQRTMRNWAIYRAWEQQFHSGEAELRTHPGHGGIDAEYDELKSWLDAEVVRLQPLPTLYKAEFRELPGQADLPGAMLRETEVAWSPSSA